MGSAEPKV